MEALLKASDSGNTEDLLQILNSEDPTTKNSEVEPSKDAEVKKVNRKML